MGAVIPFDRSKSKALPKDPDGRPLPHSAPVEAALLHSLMSPDVATPELMATLRVLALDHLFNPANQCVLAAMKELAAEGATIEVITLLAKLQHRPPPAGGWKMYLTETLAADGVHADARPSEYAKIILDRWRARELVKLGALLMEQGYGGMDSIAMLDAARASFKVIAETRTDAQGSTAFGALRKAWINLISRSQPGERGLTWGWAAVDREFGRRRTTRMSVVAAVPGVGKTNLAWQSSEAVVCEPEDDLGIGEAVYFVSAELKAEELASRQAGIRAGVPPQALEGDRDFTPEELKKLDDAQQDIASWPIIVDDNGGRPFTVADIESRVQEAKARLIQGTYTREDGAIFPRSRLRLVVVDYLQKLRPPALPNGQRYDGREREIAAISAALMELAKVLDVHVTAISAVARGGAKGEDPRKRELQMSDLRESGMIEYDAATIIFANAPDDGVLRLKNAKQRFRESGEPVDLAMVAGRIFEPEAGR